MLQTLRGKRTLREGQHSYLPSFVVASPEGLWVYSLRKDAPEMHISLDELDARDEGIRTKLLELRTI